jgi:hypothetical protein
MAKKKGSLLFLDTNILLDFYRVRRDAGISLLKHIDGLHESAIVSCQVEMEFKKNRQKVIHDSLVALKGPEASITPPAFLSEAKTVELMQKRLAETKARIGKLRTRLKRILENPATHDPVYRVAQRLFSNSSPYNLRAGTDDYNSVTKRAWDRFSKGYPPRKRDDTSMGDSINWEWIVDCANRSGRDVLIVSRDSDYGLIHDGSSYINDWLLQEFKNRLSQQRKIRVVDRLSTALKSLAVKVTPEEAEEEAETVEVSKDRKEKGALYWQDLVESLLHHRFSESPKDSATSDVTP